MTSFSRSERVREQIRKTLSDILVREVNDPRIRTATISEVQMTRDLRIARVYYAISGDAKQRDAALRGFESARGWLKRVLAGRLKLRYMPDLEFYYDNSFDYGASIDNLLKAVQVENGSNHTPSE
ncbi:MAG: 30S ribosome-binding factor RbfA [Desulfobacterales bacterium]|nr:30S ribosome-binding factor RbfA [Desulfobacterales bacterium]